MRAVPPSPTAPAEPTELRLCASPPSPQPAIVQAVASHTALSRQPGNARPWWVGPDLPLAVLEGPRVLLGCGHCNSK